MRANRLLFSIGLGLLMALGVCSGIARASNEAREPHLPTATIRYVDADASGTANGLSWANAYITLQDALAAAAYDDEIWVAEGVYYPDEGNGQVNDNRDSTFALTYHLAIYGGFDPGSGADTFAERDWEAYPTVLSGDIDHETFPDITDPSGVVTDTANIQGSNAFHVVVGSSSTFDTVLDGFTITAGQTGEDYYDYGGGGMFNYDHSRPTLNHITFSGNFAYDGGGMFNDNSNPILTDVTFSNNRAAHNGGGLYDRYSNSTLTHVNFFGNSAFQDSGGMSMDYSNSVLIDVTFSGNSATLAGGGVVINNGNPILTDVVFSDNSAIDYGGGMVTFDHGAPVLTNVSFSGNSAYYGGGMYSGNSGYTLTNVTFSGNSASYGGGIYNETSNALLTHVDFYENSADATPIQGGGILNYEGTVTMTQATFLGNIGGGMLSYWNSKNTLTNVTFHGNRDGGMHHWRSESTLTNVTFSANPGCGISNIYGHITMTNAILWGSAGEIQISNDNATTLIRSSVIQGSGGSGSGWASGYGIDGGGNLDVGPLFVREPDPGPDGLWDGVDDDYGDLHLLPGSPAIDYGTNQGCPGTDLDGRRRPINFICDMGAYETAALEIGAAVDDPHPEPGQTITFTLSVSDWLSDTQNLSGGTLSDELPTGLNFLGPIRLEPLGSGTAGSAPPTLASNVTFSYGERITVTFPVTISYGLAGGTQLLNRVTFSATEMLTPVQANVTVTVQNVVPTAIDDHDAGFASDENTAFTTSSVLANDQDPNGDALAISGLNTAGSLGLITNQGNGTFAYDPHGQFEALAVGEQATDVFTYTVSDGHGGTDTARVTITIHGANDAPTAANDGGPGFSTGENSAFTTPNVLANDSDPDGDTLSVQSFNVTGTLGTVTNNGDGAFDYDPNGQFESLAVGEQATDVFTYTVSDGHGGSDTAAVTIVITGANDAPTAADDGGIGFSTHKETAFTTPNVIANDTDPDGDTLSISAVDTENTQGLLTSNGDGTFDYDPNGQFDGLAAGEQASDVFTYIVSDGHGGSDTASVTMIIYGDNDPPAAGDDYGTGFSTDENTAFTTADVLANDSDPNGDTLTITVVDTSSMLGLLTNSGDGAFDYDPNGQFDGLAAGEQASDVFTYTVSDGHGGSDTAVVTITIYGVNNAPIATDDDGAGFIANEDTTFSTASVLANDSDPDGDTLSIQSFHVTGTLGLVTGHSNGTFDYDPSGQFEALGAGEQATDTFTYTVSDGHGSTDTAMVTITIRGANDAPIAVADAGTGFTSDEDTTFTTANVLANDSDPDGDTLTVFALDTSSTKGLVIDNGDGTFSYNPNGQFESLDAGEQATDTFTYTISDGHGGTDTATVTITINGVQDGFSVYLPLVVR